MSKRGSLNAIRFAGTSYGYGKGKSKKVAKSKPVNGRKKSKSVIQQQFDKVWLAFNPDNKQSNLSYFDIYHEFKKIKKFRERKLVISNVQYFDYYSVENNIPFTVEKYLLEKYYLLNYKELYPNLFEPQVVAIEKQKLKITKN